MDASTVRRAIRRAVALHLSALAPALVACGHSAATTGGTEAGSESGGADAGGNEDATADDATTEDAPGDGEAPSDAEAEGDGFICYLPDVAPCSLVPDAEQYCGGSCAMFCSLFNGTPEQCGVGTDGAISESQCAQHCPGGSAQSCIMTWNGSCQFGQISCEYGCVPGRKPAGLRAPRVRARSLVGALLAQTAYLEAASVDAFERLASELSAHGAPATLRRLALRAAQDERRHARVMSALARRAGASVPPPRVGKVAPRSLEKIAHENAVEGCVNETFSAALAAIQAACARDDRVRAAMQRIATDEMRHAELAWSVAAWIETRLDAAARERVKAARSEAARALVASGPKDVAKDAAEALGLPTALQARRMAHELMRALAA
jgi:rubrerythrin